MDILPAIDLRGGKCVRLEQGDATRQTVYSDDPVQMARTFAEAGASWLHVVDLDGAFNGSRVHTAQVHDITRATDLKIELGGGIRSLEDIEIYLSAGVTRVVLGTVAHTNPQFVEEAVARYGNAIAVGIDAREGTVAIRGWTEQTDLTVGALARRAEEAGVTTIIYTDIAVDGMLTGPDLPTLRMLLETISVDIIASGGIAAREHVESLLTIKPRPLAGCIIGKALYTGALNAREIITVAGGKQPIPRYEE